MTTEDDFQAKLDADPSDWQTRLVFADWLEERGDARAEGYRALAVRRWQAYQPRNNAYWTVANYRAPNSTEDVSDLPDDWFALVWDETPKDKQIRASKGLWVSLATRREVEDMAARAFAGLPAARRAELLAPPPPEPKRGKKSP